MTPTDWWYVGKVLALITCFMMMAIGAFGMMFARREYYQVISAVAFASALTSLVWAALVAVPT